MTRRYRVWAGDSRGVLENLNDCVAIVSDGGYRSVLTRQCNRKRGHGPDGLWCTQHAKMLANGRAVPQPKNWENEP